MFLSFNSDSLGGGLIEKKISKLTLYFKLNEREYFFENNYIILFLASGANVKNKVESLFIQNNLLSIPTIIRELEDDFFGVTVDKKSEEINIFRDNPGLNTGYYKLTKENKLIISNLIHDITKVEESQLCKRSVFQFLYSNFLWDGQTFYENIYEIPMGNIYTFNKEFSLCKKKKSKLIFSSKENTLSEDENIQELRKVIVDSHKKYINTKNVVLLSGGIDSVAMMIALDDLIDKSRIEAHSYKVKDAKGDETIYAKSIADHLGIPLKIFENDLTDKLTVQLFENTVLKMNIPYIGVHIYGDNFESTEQITYYAGQDTRLHTPSVNKIDLIAFKVFRMFRNFKLPMIMLDKLMILFRIWISLFHFEKSKIRALRGVLRASYMFNTDKYILKYYFKIDKNQASKYKLPTDFYEEFMQKYSFDLKEIKNERGLYNAIVTLKWKEQYVSDIRYMKDMARMKGAHLAMPFYDMKMNNFSAQIPFKLSVKQMMGRAKFGEAKQMIYKYVLRKSLENKIDKKTFYRSKAAPNSSYAMFNASLTQVLKEVISKDVQKDNSFIRKFKLESFVEEFMNQKESWEMEDEDYLIKIYNTTALIVYHNQSTK